MKFSAPVRALMVIPSFSPIIGGAETQLLGLSPHLRGLDSLDCIVTRRVGDTAAQECINRAPVFRLPAQPYPFAFWISLLWFIWRRRHAFSILHCHTMNSPVWICAIMAKLLGRPLVAKVTRSGPTGLIAKYQRSAISRAMFSLLVRTTSAFVAMTSEIAGELERTGVPKSKTFVIPNGVDVPELGSLTPMTDRNRVVYVGRLIARKRVDWAIRAFAEAVKSRNLTLSIAGDGPERAQLNELCAELGIADKVRFLGQCSREQIAELLGSARLIVLPSLSEGMSNALLEAMANGVPVIASDIDANRQLLAPGKEGLLFRDFDELVQQIRHLADNDMLADQLSRAARGRVEREYCFSVVSTRYAGIYKQLARDQMACSPDMSSA